MKRLTEKEYREKVEKNLKVHSEANKFKDSLSKLGFTFTISLYSVIFNPESQKHEYRRVEVFLNAYPKQSDVIMINGFFKELIPYKYYTLWAYNVTSSEIVLIEGFD